MNPSTQLAVLRDVLPGLRDHGVRKLVILNGHGGNDFRPIIRELQPGAGLFLCLMNWYDILPAGDFFTEPGDHAGELETSVRQHVAPELVRQLDVAGPGRSRSFRVAGLKDGWAWAPRHWIEVADDTGVGDPRHASRQKGERYLHAVVDQLAAFLVELASADPSDMYE